MSTVKFLLLTRRFPPPSRGGSGTYLKNIFGRLPADEVTVLTEWFEGTDYRGESSGMCVVRREYIKARPHSNKVVRKLTTLRMMILWATELIWLCHRNRPDCIYIGQIEHVGTLALLAKRLFGIPYIAFAYGEDLAKFRQLAYGDEPATPKRLRLRQRLWQASLLNASRIVAISHFTTAQLMALGVSRDRIIIAHPGVDTELFHPGIDVQDFRARLAPADAKMLLTVGRWTKRKGHAQVISVLPRVLEVVPNLRYVIAGRDWGEGESLRRLVKRLNLEKQVIFLGHVGDEEIPKLHCACDVFVMANYELEDSRDTEGFGIVFLEANACGKPVIGGRVGGVPDAVVHGETGLLVDSTDADALSQAIIRLLTDEPYAESLGTRGRKRALEHFTWERAAAAVREAGLAVAPRTRGAD